MKTILIVMVLALAACGGGSADIIAKVQDATKKACGFVPVASTVAAILDTVGGTGGTATMVATAAKGICAAVTAPNVLTLHNDGRKPTFNGVVIEGEFVRE